MEIHTYMPYHHLKRKIVNIMKINVRLEIKVA